ncbi:MAG TPA: NAD(+)/NADH kinase [Dehalococcoidia bacterium]|nr:NAD(+)/NADH kinase [Dehalococcoidia bacterium]HLE81429.1 NAD(+)/NADH kinase [Dehalococcoidia bacterium]
MTKLIGILYHPRLPAAQALSGTLTEVLEGKGYQVWSASAWEEQGAKDLMAGTAAVVSVGGDGTIMRAARAIIPASVPILGIRFGRLGFLAEMDPDEALERVPRLLDGAGYVEERGMLQAWCADTPVDPALNEKHHPLMTEDTGFHALNDVAVARGGAGRPIYVQVTIDGEYFTTYRADAVVLATATGSTAYSFSAGGPVLRPTSASYVLTPVAPHGTFTNSLVLEPATRVQLTVHSDHGSILSIDGQVDITLKDGETVTVQRSPYTARFLRAGVEDGFYKGLLARLRFGENLNV